MWRYRLTERWRWIGKQRIDFDRLRRERLARAKELLAKSEMGALLCFDMNNVRYITATHIGTWAQDKISRFTLLPQNDEPILWDFGSAAQASSAQLSVARRAFARRHSAAARRDVAGNGPRRRRRQEDPDRTRNARAAQGAASASTSSSRRFLFALQKEGITVVDGQQLMSDARVIKTQDEISLLNHSAMMVDAAYTSFTAR